MSKAIERLLFDISVLQVTINETLVHTSSLERSEPGGEREDSVCEKVFNGAIGESDFESAEKLVRCSAQENNRQSPSQIRSVSRCL